MSFCSVEEAIEEIKAGRFIIVLDDENRENEGDLIIAAEKATPEAINFMVRHSPGRSGTTAVIRNRGSSRSGCRFDFLRG